MFLKVMLKKIIGCNFAVIFFVLLLTMLQNFVKCLYLSLFCCEINIFFWLNIQFSLQFRLQLLFFFIILQGILKLFRYAKDYINWTDCLGVYQWCHVYIYSLFTVWDIKNGDRDDWIALPKTAESFFAIIIHAASL